MLGFNLPVREDDVANNPNTLAAIFIKKHKKKKAIDNFVNDAKTVGFTDEQAEFLYVYLSKTS